MSRKVKWPPTVHLHRRSGRAFVRINGRDIYLGPHGSDEARERYARLLAESSRDKRPVAASDVPAAALTLRQLSAAFLAQLEARYARSPVDGHTNEHRECGYAMAPALELYGSTPAAAFGPRALKAVRQAMLDAGLSVGVVNLRVGRVRRMFRWAAEEEMLPGSVWHALQAVKRLPQPAAKPKPVPVADVLAVLPWLRPVVAAMVQVQLLTGMRPGEVVIMRPCDLDRTGDVWTYRPSRHKTKWKGLDRLVLIGPRAQAFLLPYLDRSPAAYLFSPRESVAKRRRGKRQPGERYRTCSYACAIARACRRAGVPHWHPHRLRHTAATLFRATGGLDAAQLLCGHERRETTQVYAAPSPEAMDVARKVG